MLPSVCLSSEHGGDSRKDMNPPASICEVEKGGRSEVGKNYRFNAIYETDGGTYSYFRDKSPSSGKGCLKDPTIDIDRIPDMKEASVVKFFLKAKHLCEKRKMALCGYSAVMDFDAEVMQSNGFIFLHLTKVHCYGIHF